MRLFALWLLIAVAVAALLGGPGKTHATAASSYAAAPFCCLGCQYASSCCCAGADRNPKTVTRRPTKTIIRIKTVSAKKNARSFLADEEAPELFAPDLLTSGSADDEISEVPTEHALFARHLCPICPAGAHVAPRPKGKNFNGAGKAWCCPKRKTVTKTNKNTKTVFKTRTVSVASKATIKGRVYYDLNKNNIFDAGDVPISNTKIVLVLAAKKRVVRAANNNTVYGETTSDNEGRFVMTFNKQTAGTTMNVVKEDERFVPLLQFTTDSTGSAKVDVPVLQPVPPTFIPPVTVSDNKATVHGTGIPGRIIYLYANGVRVGSTVVDANGQWSVTSSKLASGTSQMTVTQANEKNAESEAIACGPATILPPPTFTSKQVKKNVVLVTGKGTAGATVKVYSDGQFVGAAVVENDGTWSLTTSALAIGTHKLTATQENASGVSDAADVGSVDIVAPTPNPPTVTSHTLDGVKAVVTGTGQPGATLKLFSDGIFVGSTTVLPDGTYSVTSSDLVPGLHSLTVSQEVNGAVSNSVDAGTVNVVPPPPTWSSTTLQQPGSSVIITGSGVPGDVIDIYEGNTKVATTTVAVDGTWSAIISTPLPVGIHSFTAKQSVDGISSSAVPAGSVTITAAASTTRAAAGTTAAPPVPTTGALAGTTTAEAAAPSTTSAGPTPTTLTLTSSSETETQSSTTSVTETETSSSVTETPSSTSETQSSTSETQTSSTETETSSSLTLTTTSLTTSTSETPTTTFTRSTTTCPGFLFNPASIPVIAQGGNAQHEIYRVSTVDGIDRAFYGGKAAGGNFTFVTETVYPGTTEAAVIFAVERVGTFKWMKGSISGVANGVQDGTGGNAVKAVAVNPSSGVVWAGGHFSSNPFGFGGSATNLVPQTYVRADGWAGVFNRTTGENTYLYGFGGVSAAEYVNDIAVDSSDTAYVLGEFYGGNIAIGGTTVYNQGEGTLDCVLFALTTSGPQWAKRFGTPNNDGCIGVAVRPGTTEVIVVIWADFGVTIDGWPNNLGNNGGKDFYFIKFGTNGTTLAAKKIGGAANEQVTRMRIYNDIIYVTGVYSGGSMVLNDTAGTFTNRGNNDGFVARFKADNTFDFIDAFTFGSSGDDVATSLLLDNAGHIFVSGKTNLGSWPDLPGLGYTEISPYGTNTSQYNGFIARFNDTYLADKFYTMGTRINMTRASQINDMVLIDNVRPMAVGWTTSNFYKDCIVSLTNADSPAIGNKNWITHLTLNTDLSYYLD